MIYESHLRRLKLIYAFNAKYLENIIELNHRFQNVVTVTIKIYIKNKS